MLLKKPSLAGALGCAAVAASAFVSMPAQAACLSTSGEMPIPYNNCVTYDLTSSPTKAILYYNDTNLSSNFYWQLSGDRNQTDALSDWEYGSNGISWTSFNPAFTGAFWNASTIFSLLTNPSAPAGNPFWIRVALPDYASVGYSIEFELRTNNNGVVGDFLGRLDVDESSNQGSKLTRKFTRDPDPVAAPVPAPLPLLGAAAAFGYSRKIRKAIRAAG